MGQIVGNGGQSVVAEMEVVIESVAGMVDGIDGISVDEDVEVINNVDGISVEDEGGMD